VNKKEKKMRKEESDKGESVCGEYEKVEVFLIP